MGKKFNSNIELTLKDVYWFMINRVNIEPAIINNDRNKLKLIRTGQIIKGEPDFDFLDHYSTSLFCEILKNEEYVKRQLGCKNFSFFDLDSLIYNLTNINNKVSTLDMTKSKIARDLFGIEDYTKRNDPHFRKYTLEDFDKFSSVLEKLARKNNKQKLAEEEDLRKCVEKNQQNENFKEF